MERSKGIFESEKILLRFDRIPRLGIRVVFTQHKADSLPARDGQTAPPRQRVERNIPQEAYRITRTPL